MYEVYKYVLEILKVSSLPKQPTLTDVIPLYDFILSEFYKLKGWVRREVKTLFQNLHPPTQTQILFSQVCQQIFGYTVIKQVDDWTLKCRVCFAAAGNRNSCLEGNRSCVKHTQA